MKLPVLHELLVLLVLATSSAGAQTAPSVQDFTGKWRIAKVLGAADGGVSSTDPKNLLGKFVRWSEGEVQFPEQTCRLRGPSVSPVENQLLETSIWGGQTIADLELSKASLAKAFGRTTTPVFQDDSGCANAVMLDHNHLVSGFSSGWIYRLDRVIPKR